MSDCPNMIPHNENSSARFYSSRQLFVTAILWILLVGTLFWALFRVHNAVTMVVFLLLVFFIRLLATRWREKFNAIMCPKPFMDWLRNTGSYQIVTMAMSQQWSKVWILFSVLPVIFWIVSFRSWVEPVFDLDQMVVTNANIEKIDREQAGRRRRSGDIVYFIDENGKRLELKSYFLEKEFIILDELKNKKKIVTIWYQDYGYLDKNRIRKIVSDGKIIKSYNKDMVIKVHKFSCYALVYLSLYLVFTIIFISVFYVRKYRIAGVRS